MSKKTWKDHLLSSGLPLEYSVTQELTRHKFLNAREFRYERKNELGVSTVFSVDVNATNILSKEMVWLDLLIECKYRHDSTRWIFNPGEYDTFFGPLFYDSFIVLDDLLADRKINFEYLNKFEPNYPLCAKGIELIDNDSNPKSIDQAIAQLAYAVPHRVASLLNHQATEKEPYVFTIIPIIVTTAELWRLRPNINIKDVRNAKEIEELADALEVIVVHKEPNNELLRYTSDLLDKDLNDTTKRN